MTNDYTVGSQNIKFTLSEDEVLTDLRLGSNLNLRGLQECGNEDHQAALTTFTEGPLWAATWGTPIPIVWNREVFRSFGEQELFQVTDGVANLPHEPPRFVLKKGFQHKATDKKVLLYNCHCLRFQNPNLDFPLERQHDARVYWTSVAALVLDEMSSDVWDAIHIVGDFNTSLNNADAWYYPGPLLGAFTRLDSVMYGFDHIVTTEGSKVTQLDRNRINGQNSDHPIQTARYQFNGS